MKKVLWISAFAPYDTVRHAGGQNHNYYLKQMNQTGEFDICLLSVCDKDEEQKIDLDEYGISHRIAVWHSESLLSKCYQALGKVIIYRDGGLYNYAKYNLLKNKIKKYMIDGDIPDIIVTQWTEASVFLPLLKKKYSRSRYYCIEEDVAYKGFARKYELQSNFVKRKYFGIRYHFLKKRELGCLKTSDGIVVMNTADKELLIKDGIQTEKITVLKPYQKVYVTAEYNPDLYSLLYFGAMNRRENYESAIWFIESVMPLIDEKFKFYVVGTDPPDQLLNKASNRVIITGYVDDVTPFFATCLCLVAPLIMGAGVKIKILEALSAGIPVLTNELGVEGISIKAGKEYIHCVKPEDYRDAILSLQNDEDLRMRLSENGKHFIKDQLDLQRSIEALHSLLLYGTNMTLD